jgi:hypothetical protein
VSEDRFARIEATIAALTHPLRLAGGRSATLYCSFCGKSQHEVDKLVAGPKVLHLQRMHRSLLRNRPSRRAAVSPRQLSRRHSHLSRSILFCRIVVISLTLALPGCTDFKKDFLCRPDGHCVNAIAGHTPTQ